MATSLAWCTKSASVNHRVFCVYVRRTATDLALLKTLRVTHVLNAAHGPAHIDTGSAFYSDTHIQYHGVEAPDSRDFDLSVFFHTTADFIHMAVTRDCKNTTLSVCMQLLYRTSPHVENSVEYYIV